MRLPEFAYIEPENLDIASKQLEDYNGNCTIIAGGTDLVVSLKQRLHNYSLLISLDKIPSLKGITLKESTLVIGPMSSLEDILNFTFIKEKFPALRKAAREIGSPLLRSIATIGGNICLNTRCRFYNQSYFWRSSRETCFKAGGSICHVTGKKNSCNATFSADIPPVLIAYGAKVTLKGAKGTRTLPLENFYTGDGRFPNEILGGSKEILTAIELPVPQEQIVSTYRKYRLRNAIDFPMVGVAAVMKINREKRCEDARIILTGVGSAPVEAKQVCAKIRGQKLHSDLISAAAETAVLDLRLFKTSTESPRYKREMVKVIIAEAIREAGGF